MSSRISPEKRRLESEMTPTKLIATGAKATTTLTEDVEAIDEVLAVPLDTAVTEVLQSSSILSQRISQVAVGG